MNERWTRGDHSEEQTERQFGVRLRIQERKDGGWKGLRIQ